MKRIVSFFIILFAAFISFLFINVYASSDNNTNSIITNSQIPVQSYEQAESYSNDNLVTQMSYGEKSLGVLNVIGAKDSGLLHNGFKAYEAVNDVTFSYYYDSNYLDSNNDWHMIADHTYNALGISFYDAIKMGVIIVQNSTDSIEWDNTDIMTNYFANNNENEFVTVSFNEFKQGIYYRIIVLYQMENINLGISVKCVEQYEFYILDNNGEINVVNLTDDYIGYIHNDSYISSMKSSDFLFDGGITTTGFYVDNNGYIDYDISIKKNDEDYIHIDRYMEFRDNGKYTISYKSPLGNLKSITIYVFTEAINYGFDVYFDNEIIVGEKIYSDNIKYSSCAEIFIKSNNMPPIDIAILNITTNSNRYISDSFGGSYYNLELGRNEISASIGDLALGEVITFDYSLEVLNQISIPNYNYQMLMENKILNLKHYEVSFNSSKILFSMDDYADAYKYAYKIEESFVNNNYYKDKMGEIVYYQNNNDLLEMLDYYAKKRIEVAYFTDASIKIEKYNNLYDDLLYLNIENDKYISDSDNYSSLYMDAIILNDYTFKSIVDYDSISVVAYCHNNKKTYNIDYDVSISKQLTVYSKYTIIEENIYGNINEYYAYYVGDDLIINSTIDNLSTVINQDLDGSVINVDSFKMLDTKVDELNNSIVIIESTAYSYKLIGKADEIKNLGIYKCGVYTITCINSFYSSYSFKLIVSGEVEYKDLIKNEILSYTQLYNNIHINDLDIKEELLYDRFDLYKLNNRVVDINKYTYSSYLNYSNCLSASLNIYSNEYSTEIEINEIAFKLIDAYDSLIESIDKTNLYNKIFQYENIDSNLYVSSTYQKFISEYEYACDVYKKDDISYIDILNCCNRLDSSYNGLILRGNKTNLINIYDDACSKNELVYTPISYKKLSDSILKAKQVIDNIDATQTDIDFVYNSLYYDFNNLMVRANYSELQKIFNEIENIREWKYTTKSIDNLNQEMDFAYKIYLEQNETQEYVNQIVLSLNKQINELELCGDETKLHDLLVELSTIHTAIYKKETIDPLLQKVKEANEIIKYRYSQEVIDSIIDELNELYEGLEIREDKEKLYYKLIEYSETDYSGVSANRMSSFIKVYNKAYEVLNSNEATSEEIEDMYNQLIRANEIIFEEIKIELVSPWVIIIVCLASLLALVLANNLMKEVFDCERVGLLILWIPSIIALPLLFIFTPFVGGIIMLIEFGVIVVSMIIGIVIDINL